MRSNIVEIVVEIVHETERAYLVNDGLRDAWVPKSQCELYPTRDGKTFELHLPQRLAEEKGFI